MKYLICLLLFTGCTSATYQKGDSKITYNNSIFQKSFSELTLNPDGTLSIKGYQSEAASIAKATAEGVATVLVKGAK
jgi:hypothetical protein